ncbi:MAG: LPP20 family lipoprotein [Candidatus Cloacimonas sp.]|jgi:hypothetical protein|nr:LPP20 family lipoprotein [Candidatus Cloacimonas sp.]
MKYLGLIFVLLLTACSLAKKEPVWVLQHPVDSGFYTAVIRTSKQAPNYTDTARDNALREISTQISVQIDSDIALKETEANGIASSELVSQIRSSSRNKLANIQLAGSYETDKEYWAFYRLSKSDYQAWRKQQRDLAVQQALPLLSEFDDSTADAAPGITALLKALELIVDYTDMDLSTSYNGQEVNLYNELFSRLNRLPENLKPELAVANLPVVAKQRQTHIVPATMYYFKDKQKYSCKAFPLVFSFVSGKGDIVNTTLTDNEGKADLVIRRITDFTDPQQISMAPDKQYWLSRIENPIVKQMFKLLQFPPAILNLKVSRPKAYLDYSFDNTAGSAYRDLLVRKLQDLDLEVVADSSKSDFTFKVIVISRDGDFVPSLKLYSAKADAYVELLQSKGYSSLYNTNLTNIKSTGLTTETARKMSELNSIVEINDKLMYMLVEQYIMY